MTDLLRAAITLVMLAALSSCMPSATVPAQPTPPSPRYGAPTVDRPLDVSAIYADPCNQLTPQELNSLGFSDRGRSRSYLGDSECRWISTQDDILAMSIDRDRDLLADTYRARLLPIFVPVRVEGYPAVRQQTRPEDNNCIVTIGLGPKQALEADWTGLGTLEPGDPDPCERAETAAAMVIRKLPPQQR